MQLPKRNPFYSINNIYPSTLINSTNTPLNLIISRNQSQSLPINLNKLKIQLLPQQIHENLFGDDESITECHSKIAFEVLKKFDLDPEIISLVSQIKLKLPQLASWSPPSPPSSPNSSSSSSLAQHFRLLGIEQAEPYLSLCKEFALKDIPVKPRIWSMTPGWTEYTNDSFKSVEYPDSKYLVFDVEVIVTESPYPIMATACSDKHWYSWTSPELESESVAHTLISINPFNKDMIVIGHSVSYDRARIKEEYTFKPTKTGFVDTMSLHSSVSGLSSQQRNAWKSERGLKKMPKMPIKTDEETVIETVGKKDWMFKASTSSLLEVARLYLGVTLDKSNGKIFVKGSKSDVKSQFQELMQYCSNDVEATFKIFKIKCPHQVSFVGMMKLGKCFLPVNDTWHKFIKNAESAFDVKRQDISTVLTDIALQTLETSSCDQKTDLSLMQLDWTIRPSKKIPDYLSTGNLTPKRRKMLVKESALKDKPKWFCDLWNSDLERIDIGLGMQVVPLLLGVKYLDRHIMHHPVIKWFYGVPKDIVDKKLKELSIDQSNDGKDQKKDEMFHKYASINKQNVYYKVPHIDGNESNCGNPLGKSYKKVFEKGIMTFGSKHGEALMISSRICGYWVSARDRIVNQFVVKYDNESSIIIPHIVAMGTVTRRVVERTWMTLSNPQINRIGSEVKSLVKPPPGYKLIGADVDSEELWIASLLGDSQFGIHGATPLGFMTLQGTKANGNDLHSRTAKILGVSRNDAKIFNYARIYGAGVNYAARILKECSTNTTDEEAKNTAKKLYLETKGFKEKKSGIWHGGSESFMFNIMEHIIAKNGIAETPALKCLIPNALESSGFKGKINWVVQSSGVDYLHLILVSMDYLCRRMGIDTQFMLSIHDEVRYMVKEEDQHKAAYALQLSNMWTRAFFSYQSVAFFSSVDIDHCLRKEVDLDCITPSNSEPMKPGISQDINDTILQLQNETIESLFGEEIPSISALKSGFDWTHFSNDLEDPVAPYFPGSAYLREQAAQSRKELMKLRRPEEVL